MVNNMKNLKVLAIGVLASLCVVSTASAQVGVTRTGEVAVESVSIGGSGDSFIRTSGAFVDRCPSSNTSLYVLPNAHGARNSLVAVLLTAQASGANIDITVGSACVTIGANTFQQVVSINLVGA